MQILQQLKDRRLFRIVLSAVAGGWVVLEAIGSFIERGILPDVTYRVGLVWYAAAIAASALIGWHHGEKGRQKAPPSEVVALILLLVVTIGGSGWTLATYSGPEDEMATAGPTVDDEVTLHRSRVVVAPLRNETQDPSLEALGRMGADWITEGLHRTGIVDVVPSPLAIQASRYVDGLVESGMAEGRMVDPLRALAEETGSGTVVSGSYYLFGEDVHIQMQITNAASGDALDQLDPIIVPRSEPAPGLELLRARVMGSLALNFNDLLEGHAAQAESPPDYEAYQAFSRGIEAYISSDWEESVEHFENARRLDPTFALPLMYESFSRSNLGQNQAADSVVDLLAANSAELSPYHRAWVRHLEAQFDLDRPSALEAIRDAAEMAPGSKASYNASWLAVINRRPIEALDWLDRLEPGRGPMRGWFHYWNNRGHALHLLEEHETEVENAQEAVRRFPNVSQASALLATALIAVGRIDEAMELARQAPTHPGTDRTPGWILEHISNALYADGYIEEEREVTELALEWYEDQLLSSPTGAERQSLLEGRQAALYSLSRYQESQAALDELQAEFGDSPRYHSRRAVLLAWLGDWPGAAESAAALDSINDPFGRPYYTMQQARVAAISEDFDRAVSLYARALQEGIVPPLDPGRDFMKMRDHPGLLDLLRPRG